MVDWGLLLRSLGWATAIVVGLGVVLWLLKTAMEWLEQWDKEWILGVVFMIAVITITIYGSLLP